MPQLQFRISLLRLLPAQESVVRLTNLHSARTPQVQVADTRLFALLLPRFGVQFARSQLLHDVEGLYDEGIALAVDSFAGRGVKLPAGSAQRDGQTRAQCVGGEPGRFGQVLDGKLAPPRPDEPRDKPSPVR